MRPRGGFKWLTGKSAAARCEFRCCSATFLPRFQANCDASRLFKRDFRTDDNIYTSPAGFRWGTLLMCGTPLPGSRFRHRYCASTA